VAAAGRGRLSGGFLQQRATLLERGLTPPDPGGFAGVVIVSWRR
jgi:hypothetical protein